MTTKETLAPPLCALALAACSAIAGCSRQAPPAPAAKKEEPKAGAARPMPPAAPTAAPAEGEKK